MKMINFFRPKPACFANPSESIAIEKNLLYVAIPKTGSSTIRSQCAGRAPYFNATPHLNLRELRWIFFSFLVYERLGQTRNFPSYSTPSYDDLVREFEGIWSGLKKFSFVRNPWRRVISMYKRREGIQVSDVMSFSEFVEKLVFASDTCIHPSRHRQQVDWLKDDSGNLGVDSVWRIEDLQTKREEIADYLGVDFGDYKLNKNPAVGVPDLAEFYDSRAKKKVAQLFEEDIERFEYTFE